MPDTMPDPFRDLLQAALGATVQLGRELGGGGMSRVFLARDSSLGREVVVKVLAPELAQEFSVERFGREIALAAALQHANIVPVLSAGVTVEGLPFYLMPFVEGASLRDRVTGGRGLPVADVLLVLGDVTRALVYAHGRGVVHRDIKPDNVMLSGGAALVTDFGIAKAMGTARATSAHDGQLTRMGTSIGSPAYMAPEQGAGDPAADHRADLYALGAMAYELLTGQPPFGDRAAHAQLVAHLSEAPVPVTARRADVPAPLAELVMRCLAKDPADRPQHAADLLEPLADAASIARLSASGRSATPNATGNTPGAPDARGAVPGAATPYATTGVPRTRRTTLAVAGLVLVAAAAAAGWRFTRAAPPRGPDATLVAVMPFTVRDAALGVWREGMVDILSRSLDGAGVLRTVAPSRSIAQAPERGDVATATTLGQALGAGLVVFGELSPQGSDSVRLRAALVDVAQGRVRADVAVSGEALRVDALADSLALRLLRSMGSAAAQASLTTMGTSSVPALKAYLQGQQLYRRGAVDSSRLAYEAAVAADSLFALAWRGVASTYIRTGRESAPEAQAALDRAIRLRRGGSPRDSLLLRGDSLRLTVVRRAPVADDALRDLPDVRALLTTLRDATARYPGDAELWLELGDAGYHFGALAGVPDTVVLGDFERAIALDSMLSVPYVHAYGLALRTGQLRDAAGHARHLARLLGGEYAPLYQLQAALLDSAPAVSRAARHLLDSVPAPYAVASIRELSGVPSAGELTLAVAALLEARLRAGTVSDSATLWRGVLLAQAQRGRTVNPRRLTFGDRAQLAAAGLLPPADVVAEGRTLLAQQPASARPALALFAAARDTAAVRALVPVFDSLDAAAAGAGRPTRTTEIARAFLALARGDSASALRGFLSVPMTECGGAPCAALTTAGLLVAAGRDADAARVLDRALPVATTQPQLTAPLLMERRAAIAARQGDWATARMWYERALAQWERGDAIVQSFLARVRDGLTRVR